MGENLNVKQFGIIPDNYKGNIEVMPQIIATGLTEILLINFLLVTTVQFTAQNFS